MNTGIGYICTAMVVPGVPAAALVLQYANGYFVLCVHFMCFALDSLPLSFQDNAERTESRRSMGMASR